MNKLNKSILPNKNGRKSTSGITLIALIITIIVLLILAGVTIAQLTGSDSAPAKANESAQKNDIGVAKDDISMTVVNAKMQGMETVYVGNEVSAEKASTTVGTEVIKAVAQKYQSNNQIGKATIEIAGFGTIENVTQNAIVSVYTTDFIIEGTITLEDGILFWGEIEEIKPGIKLDISSPLTIMEGKEQVVTAILKQIPADTELTWESDKLTKVTVTPILNTNKAKIEGIAKTDTNEKATITVTAGEYSASVDVIVKDFILGEPATGSAVNYGKKVIDYKSNAESKQDEIGWRLFYQDTEGNTYLIADKLIGSYKPGDYYDASGADYGNGSKVGTEGKGLNASYYGYTYNNIAHWGFTPNNTALSIRAVAWMTDTSNALWSQYTDSNKGADAKATFAIASPTIDLYLKSYNAVAALSDSDAITAIAEPTLSRYGGSYSSWPSGLTTGANEIYAKLGQNWWLASSCGVNGYDYYGFFVNSTNVVTNTVYGSTFALRPVVCIPTSAIGNTYHLES